MSADPLAGSIGSPQSLNRYSYVLNDPANLTDSLGLGFWIDCMMDDKGCVGGGGNPFGCTFNGAPFSCSFGANLAFAGGAAVLPPGMSTFGFMNGHPYFLSFTDQGLNFNYFGISPATAAFELGLLVQIGGGPRPTWPIAPGNLMLVISNDCSKGENGAGDRAIRYSLATRDGSAANFEQWSIHEHIDTAAWLTGKSQQGMDSQVGGMFLDGISVPNALTYHQYFTVSPNSSPSLGYPVPIKDLDSGKMWSLNTFETTGARSSTGSLIKVNGKLAPRQCN